MFTFIKIKNILEFDRECDAKPQIWETSKGLQMALGRIRADVLFYRITE